MKNLLAALCAALAFTSAHAAVDVAGVTFEDQTQVADQTLQLNGAGLRTKLFFKVYAMGLYLPAKAKGTAAVLASTGARRIDITTLRDLSAEQFADALSEGLQKNLSEAEQSALKADNDAFRANLLSLKSAKEGTRIQIDFTPAGGTRLVVNGKPHGEAIGTIDFSNALLRVWIGDAPAQGDLKSALIGE
ncbi:chalcone isomerase family protein [Denitromonas ohlonensis]|uniref:Chalcone isomerase domain-containing protein n=2 Tax=Denitromonas TaxID=139331 RepID=A0A557RC44_9RHOO|nr:chalcone isomerase family protein [Denitromonas ohlonensis]TVT49367.1 MAG: hypothetical protein FHP94_07215 [Denitromonas halophila]TVO62731.1 hypothetical protein FHP90_17100 [Denitromonas ohlonensis]TVO78936.1 hypothetical protein FHP89_04585 [Denitromonas ohlonensis]TVT74573.1 MAG: hypothetical protein FHP93_04105 [Denitromonas halophila]TVT75093.1 MAG: hypothetical protein FHP92_11935 [Denitromonas halophila]